MSRQADTTVDDAPHRRVLFAAAAELSDWLMANYGPNWAFRARLQHAPTPRAVVADAQRTFTRLRKGKEVAVTPQRFDALWEAAVGLGYRPGTHSRMLAEVPVDHRLAVCHTRIS